MRMPMSMSGRTATRLCTAAAASLALVAAGTAGASAASGPIQGPGGPVLAAQPEFQLTINTSPYGDPLQTIRNSSGAWTAWDQVPDMYYNPGYTDSLTQAESGGQLYVASMSGGQIQFEIYNDATATWSSPTGTSPAIGYQLPTGSICPTWGCTPDYIAQLDGSAMVGGNFDLIAQDTNGALWEAVDDVSSNSWSAWTPVDLAPIGEGGFTQLAVASTNGEDLNLVAIMNGRLYQSVRSTPTGTFSAWNDVFTAANSNPGTPTQVAAAGVNGALQVMVAVNSGNGLDHAILSNGTWSTFGNVESVSGTNPGTIEGIAMAGTGMSSTADVMEFALVNSTGIVYHGTRNLNGSWTAMGNVLGQAGALPSGQTAISVTAAGE